MNLNSFYRYLREVTTDAGYIEYKKLFDSALNKVDTSHSINIHAMFNALSCLKGNLTNRLKDLFRIWIYKTFKIALN